MIKYLFLLMFLTACGSDKDSFCELNTECSALKASEKALAEAQDFVIRGSVNSAFALTVDGKDYSDIEEYFTAESGNLQDKVSDAGYKGYKVRFDAAIGFNDLTQGMTVYIAAKEKRGYQTKTLIAKNDTFAAKLPKEASGDVYQIKANKRISLILTKGNEIKKFCYNFAAVDLEVPYEAVDSPIILSSFKTSLTTYECQQDAGSDSLKVPENSDKPSKHTETEPSEKVVIYDELRDILTPGLSLQDFNTKLSEVISKYGIKDLYPDTNMGEIYFKYSKTGGLCETDLPNTDQDCALVIGGNGRATIENQANIRIEYLSPEASW